MKGKRTYGDGIGLRMDGFKQVFLTLEVIIFSIEIVYTLILDVINTREDGKVYLFYNLTTDIW